MSTYLGYVCLNTEDIPSNVSTATHVRVRIPQLHGHPDNDLNQPYLLDSQLPFARVTRPIDVDTFNAIDYFKDGTVVIVSLLNNDANNLLIGGVLGNYTYTNDSEEINRRKTDLTNSALSYSDQANLLNDIVSTAQNELYSVTKLTDAGKLKIKYNDWFSGVAEGSGKGPAQDWSTVFTCWVFHKSGCGRYFNNNIKSANAQEVLDTHKLTNELVEGGAKNAQAGDLIFVSSTSPKTPSRVDIAVSKYNSTTKSVKCIGGNIQLSDTDKQGIVNEVDRPSKKIVAVVRPGSAICVNGTDPNWKQWDARWASEKIPGGETVKAIGCLMTSVAILLRMTGLTKQDFNPKVFNTWLKQNGGYTSGGLFNWSACNDYVKGWKVNGSAISLEGLSTTEKYNKIKKLINDGYYVVAHVGKGTRKCHFVAVTGYTANDITKSDPYVSSTSLLNCNTYNSVFSVRYYTCSTPFKCK